MSDDLKKKGPVDASRINVNESWEVGYWTKKWGINEAQLRAAVKAVGVEVKAVQKQLGK